MQSLNITKVRSHAQRLNPELLGTKVEEGFYTQPMDQASTLFTDIIQYIFYIIHHRSEILS